MPASEERRVHRRRRSGPRTRLIDVEQRANLKGPDMTVLINVDVPELERGIAFYAEAFGLRVSRRFGEDVAEMSGWPVPLYLLRNAQGSTGAPGSKRTYERHWTPLHMDVVVEDIDAALSRATKAGAVIEKPVRADVWGKIAVLADPFGHGFCLIQFLNRGYDEIADQPGAVS